MSPETRPERTRFSRAVWLLLAGVVVVSVLVQSYGIATWPMADDEVPSLVEMGLRQQDPGTFSVPASQVPRLRATAIVWYSTQRFLLSVLPPSDVSYRLPSVAYSVLTVALAFLLAFRWRGLWFAVAIVMLLDGSQLFVYLAQLDRFYSLASLLLLMTTTAIWVPARTARAEIGLTIGTAVLAVLTMLTHNLTLVVFLLAAVASAMAVACAWVPRHVLRRSVTAATAGLLLYVAYIRPLVSGWNSTGNPTPVLISYAAEAGVPLLALTLMGVWLAWKSRREDSTFLWWVLMWCGGICACLLAWFNWNPRYFILFMPAMWILAALTMETVARRLAGGASGVVWYGAVAVLLLPGLASHWQDGSRHDYREAAEVVAGTARSGEPILSDDAETISYYLPDELRSRLEVRTKVVQPPVGSFVLVVRSNAWTPQPQITGRQITLIDEISRRRFDEFSHVLRIYRVSPLS